jgi:predicted transcriptional regulator
MYNNDLVEALIKEFGLQETIVYCKLESKKNDIMYSHSRAMGEIGSSEWEYERDWWAEKGNELSTLKLNKNERVRTFGKKPKISNSRKTVVSVKVAR